MQLTIISPEKTIFKGEIESINVPGKKGRFTVLKNHAPIISTLTKGDIFYKTAEKEDSITIDSGLIEVNNNNVTICIEQ